MISQGAEKRPEKVTTFIYLAAFLLRHDESLLQVALPAQYRLNKKVIADRSSLTHCEVSKW